MEIINTKSEHITQACSLYSAAINYFKSQNIDQWQNGYPCKDSLIGDISRGESYVMLCENDVIATFMMSTKAEPTYQSIYNGAWQYSGDYGVIHRVAVASDAKGQGIMGQIVCFAADFCKSKGLQAIRCDTHRDNISMQKALLKNGFIYSGIIYLDENNKEQRLVYEKLI